MHGQQGRTPRRAASEERGATSCEQRFVYRQRRAASEGRTRGEASLFGSVNLKASPGTRPFVLTARPFRFARRRFERAAHPVRFVERPFFLPGLASGWRSVSSCWDSVSACWQGVVHHLQRVALGSRSRASFRGQRSTHHERLSAPGRPRVETREGLAGVRTSCAPAKGSRVHAPTGLA